MIDIGLFMSFERWRRGWKDLDREIRNLENVELGVAIRGSSGGSHVPLAISATHDWLFLYVGKRMG